MKVCAWTGCGAKAVYKTWGCIAMLLCQKCGDEVLEHAKHHYSNTGEQHSCVAGAYELEDDE